MYFTNISCSYIEKVLIYVATTCDIVRLLKKKFKTSGRVSYQRVL